MYKEVVTVIIIHSTLQEVRRMGQKIYTAITIWLRQAHTNGFKVSKGAKIRNRYNQVPHLTQDTNGKVTNSQAFLTDRSQQVQVEGSTIAVISYQPIFFYSGDHL